MQHRLLQIIHQIVITRRLGMAYMLGESELVKRIILGHRTILASTSQVLPKTPSSRYEAVKSIEHVGIAVGVNYDLAQLQFRYCVDDPKESLENAIALSIKLAKFWATWNHLPGSSLFPEPQFLPNGKPILDLPRRIDGVNFRFAAASIISLLVRKEISPSLLEVVPKTSDFGEITNDFHYWNFTDAGLVEILLTGRRPRRWKEILEFATKRFRNTQIQDNFESYATLILSCQKGKWDAAINAVAESERLYASRPYDTGDKTYFEAWEVSPPKGPQGVDLRLAALMKYCFRENRKLLKQFESLLKW